MAQALNYLHKSASQTAGPYVHIGLAPGAAGFRIFENELGQVIAGPDVEGERITISGSVIDGTGAPVKDALIEIWQADASGHYVTPENAGDMAGFRGWGRVITDFETGKWSFETVKPGAVMGRNGRMMAPHLNLWIVARGINIGLNTRLYFSDEEEANAADPVLGLIEQAHRRATLIAKRDSAKPAYHFDIRLQGEDETVFFDI